LFKAKMLADNTSLLSLTLQGNLFSYIESRFSW